MFGILEVCMGWIKNETLKGDEEIRRTKMELEREIKGKYFLFYHL
jgi:hypothetical protein